MRGIQLRGKVLYPRASVVLFRSMIHVIYTGLPSIILDRIMKIVNSSYQMLNPWDLQEFFFVFYIMRIHSQLKITAWTKKSLPFQVNITMTASLLACRVSTNSQWLGGLVPMTNSITTHNNTRSLQIRNRLKNLLLIFIKLHFYQ